MQKKVEVKNIAKIFSLHITLLQLYSINVILAVWIDFIAKVAILWFWIWIKYILYMWCADYIYIFVFIYRKLHRVNKKGNVLVWFWNQMEFFLYIFNIIDRIRNLHLTNKHNNRKMWMFFSFVIKREDFFFISLAKCCAQSTGIPPWIELTISAGKRIFFQRLDDLFVLFCAQPIIRNHHNF